MNKNFKFEFYGWLVVLSIILNIVLISLKITFPFLALGLAIVIYSLIFHKKIEKTYIINVIITELVVIGLIALGIIAIFASIGVVAQ